MIAASYIYISIFAIILNMGCTDPVIYSNLSILQPIITWLYSFIGNLDVTYFANDLGKQNIFGNITMHCI